MKGSEKFNQETDENSSQYSQNNYLKGCSRL